MYVKTAEKINIAEVQKEAMAGGSGGGKGGGGGGGGSKKRSGPVLTP